MASAVALLACLCLLMPFPSSAAPADSSFKATRCSAKLSTHDNTLVVGKSWAEKLPVAKGSTLVPGGCATWTLDASACDGAEDG
jgi:hypothetical protein